MRGIRLDTIVPNPSIPCEAVEGVVPLDDLDHIVLIGVLPHISLCQIAAVHIVSI